MRQLRAPALIDNRCRAFRQTHHLSWSRAEGVYAHPDLVRLMLDAQPPIRGTRDVRIDFFRGLALYMILVDHVVGDPIGKLTFRSVGFSDAAELFVFLS
ncbi:MAG: OpgC domain-containing protein, partial [Hyphomicrobium sp.]